MIKRILILAFLSLSFVSVARAETLNEIAAVVNNDAITSAQLNRQLNLIKFRAKQAGKNNELPSDEVLREQILQQLINRSLQLQMAKNSGLKATSEQINTAIEQIAQNNHVNVRELYKKMEKNGFTIAQFRQEVADEVTIQLLEGRDVASRINISEVEVNDLLKRMQSQKVEYHFGDILIALPATPSPEQIEAAQSKANTIVKQLDAGANFEKMAMAHSNASNALKGGDMGWRKLAEIPDIFSSRVVSMNPGEVAGPLRAPNGFHIIKLYGMRNAKIPKTSEARRKEIENLLFQQQFQQELMTWLQQLRAEAYIKIYMK